MPYIRRIPCGVSLLHVTLLASLSPIFATPTYAQAAEPRPTVIEEWTSVKAPPAPKIESVKDGVPCNEDSE